MPTTREYSPLDFLYGTILGEGLFGSVVYAELINDGGGDRESSLKDDVAVDDVNNVDTDTPCHDSNKAYAIKLIPKSEIIRHNQIHAVLTEKYILTEVLSSTSEEEDNPASELFMKLFLCFHDANYLYLVLELCAGGTLLDLIQSNIINNSNITISYSSPVMDISWARYYACKTLLAVEYLHQKGIVHCDLSPQNIGLTYPKGEIKLGDFGAAAMFVQDTSSLDNKLKRWTPKSSSTTTFPVGRENLDFVGTAGYVSPEMIHGNNEEEEAKYSNTTYPAMDLWSFGCLIYCMMVGKSPFHALCDDLSIQSMLEYANGKRELNFPSFIDSNTKDLILSLLAVDLKERIGVQDNVIESVFVGVEMKQYTSIRNHAFFQTAENTSIWSLKEELDPPYKPEQPDWLAKIHRDETALKPFDSIAFDI